MDSSPYHGSYCPIDVILAALPGKRLDGEIVDRCGLYLCCSRGMVIDVSGICGPKGIE